MILLGGGLGFLALDLGAVAGRLVPPSAGIGTILLPLEPGQGPSKLFAAGTFHGDSIPGYGETRKTGRRAYVKRGHLGLDGMVVYGYTFMVEGNNLDPAHKTPSTRVAGRVFILDGSREK